MLYLIHFDKPYKHARHYRGYVSDGKGKLAKRIDRHRSGQGARILAVVTAAGIGWDVVRVWKNGTRKEERRLKKLKVSSICPICQKEQASSNG